MKDGKENVTEGQALEAVRNAINSVLKNRWMICVWGVEMDGRGESKGVEMIQRSTWKFPKDHFNKAIEQLTESLEKEKGATVPAVPEPLKTADFLLDREVEQKDEEKEEPRIMKMVEEFEKKEGEAT